MTVTVANPTAQPNNAGANQWQWRINGVMNGRNGQPTKVMTMTNDAVTVVCNMAANVGQYY